MTVFTQETTYENLDLPDIVYKYRFWDSEHPFHKTILTQQEVYFRFAFNF